LFFIKVFLKIITQNVPGFLNEGDELLVEAAYDVSGKKIPIYFFWIARKRV
jgi:hypothetical protein